MPAVFVSYRRSDTGGEAGRLVDTLAREIGRGFAFRDVVNLSAGERFDAALERAVGEAEVVLVLIGAEWLGELQRRLALPETDYHRAEIADALRQGKRVLPLLVGTVAMPSAAQLPADLQPLTRCHALGLRDEAWAQDVARLADALGRPYRWDWLLLRLLLGLPLLLVAGWQLTPLLFAQRVSDYGFQRSVLLSLLATHALAEAAWAWRHRQRLTRLRKAPLRQADLGEGGARPGEASG